MPDHSDNPIVAHRPAKANPEGPLEFLDFWGKVDKKNGPIPKLNPELERCWLWTGKIRPNGYGMAWNMATGKEMRAHRASYIMKFGHTDLDVCHHCDNPPCVRPSHLFADTAKGNAQDAVRKGRVETRRVAIRKMWDTVWSKTQIGEGGNNAKLKEWEAIQIIKLRLVMLGSFRVFSDAKLGSMFGIAARTINGIGRRSWKHLLPTVAPSSTDDATS